MVTLLLALLALALIVFGVVQLFNGAVVFGIVLIIAGLLVAGASTRFRT